MNRREILQRRKYAAIPKATLARGDLTAATKIVYTGLIGQLFSDDADEVHITVARITELTGVGPRTVKRALAALAGAGLLAVRRQAGLAAIYSFPASDTGAKMAPPPGQNGPTPPGQNGPGPGSIWPHPRAKMAPPYKELERSLEHIEPPKPPEEERDEVPIKTKTQTKTQTKTDRAIAIENLAGAYREATGRKMPARWMKAAETEFDDGGCDLLAEIDAAAIRRALAFAQKRGLAFAWGTLILSIHQKPRPDAPAALAAADRAAADDLNLKKSDTERFDRRMADTIAAAAEYFSGLDAEVRDRYRRLAAGMPAVEKLDATARENLAAVRAYNDRPEAGRDQNRKAAG